MEGHDMTTPTTITRGEVNRLRRAYQTARSQYVAGSPAIEVAYAAFIAACITFYGESFVAPLGQVSA